MYLLGPTWWVFQPAMLVYQRVITVNIQITHPSINGGVSTTSGVESRQVYHDEKFPLEGFWGLQSPNKKSWPKTLN